MDISEIISDALVYPINNIKALIIYVILGIIAGIAAGGSVFSLMLGAADVSTALTGGLGVIGMIIAFVLFLLITGYELDIVKYGINRDPGAPGIDFVRQVLNAIKLIIVEFVYYIIPIIIIILLSFIFRNWIIIIVAFILAIIFSLALFMAVCRLAKTDSLGEALAIGEAIGDISRVGLINILLLVILLFVIAFIVAFILAFITKVNATIGGILLGIFAVYFSFVSFRATGLLYSNA
ncbi:MAG: DUF4013 domain-containing protein [Methanobrevibacter sp.]|nr:DUF4013 domain-containing protein [Methanobrevibacter sp.]